ncbi:hypothetical protein [Marinibacterium sp. SX1]|uniref:hypothetical protein n=1 Tax=Marinibacterium sp. SX1 TaxID=3388424 RepID=UPI003D180B96
MTRLALIFALGLSTLGLTATASLAQGKAAKVQRPPVTHAGQWYTAPNGCSYSRAQAPGYPPTWHLIQNPHHIGKPNARGGCPAML